MALMRKGLWDDPRVHGQKTVAMGQSLHADVGSLVNCVIVNYETSTVYDVASIHKLQLN